MKNNSFFFKSFSIKYMCRVLFLNKNFFNVFLIIGNSLKTFYFKKREVYGFIFQKFVDHFLDFYFPNIDSFF